MTAVPAVAKHVKQRAGGKQQEWQIRQPECEVGPVLGKQIERGNREQ